MILVLAISLWVLSGFATWLYFERMGGWNITLLDVIVLPILCVLGAITPAVLLLVALANKFYDVVLWRIK